MEPGNILKIESLGEGWRDKDSVMLHACFQLLKDCVEQENLFTGHIDWETDEHHRWAKQELLELYNWWLLYHKPNMDLINPENYEIETNMLIRLIKVRWALWT